MFKNKTKKKYTFKPDNSRRDFAIAMSILFVIYIISAFLLNTKTTSDNKTSTDIYLQTRINQCLNQAKSSKEKGVKCFDKLVSENDTYLTHLHYANMLFDKSEYKKAKEHYENVINSKDKPAFANKLAQEKIKQAEENITTAAEVKQEDTSAKFEYAFNRIVRWEDPTDIKVCIADVSHRKMYIKEAFKIWDSSLYSLVDFKYTDNQDKADIIVYIDKVPTDCGEETIGCTQYDVVSNKQNPNLKIIKKVVIYIEPTNENGEKYTDDEIRSVALHEIGHALGIEGHSPLKEDIMYANTDSELYAKSKLSERDVEAVRKIY